MYCQFVLFWDKLLFCSSGWPWIHSCSPASASQVLALQSWDITTNKLFLHLNQNVRTSTSMRCCWQCFSINLLEAEACPIVLNLLWACLGCRNQLRETFLPASYIWKSRVLYLWSLSHCIFCSSWQPDQLIIDESTKTVIPSKPVFSMSCFSVSLR